MEELFDLLIAVAGIAVVVIKAVSNTKKVKDNAPGKAAAPAKPAAPARPSAPVSRPQSAQPTVRPTLQPATAEPGNFWKQVGAELMKELGAEPEKKEQAHGRVPNGEGDSRECGHGSVGGSMEYGAHEGGRAAAQKEPVRTVYDRKAENVQTAYRPAMTAQEMRRAVVMAEILKRPQERMSEQARRWSVR